MKNSGRTEAEVDSDIGMIISGVNQNPKIGYNALTNTIVNDMVKEGIIDAFKVVRIALENASEGVASLLTTEIVEAEEIINNNKE